MEENVGQLNIQLNNPSNARDLFGTNDLYLKLIESTLSVEIISRGENMLVSGREEDVMAVERVLLSLLVLIKKEYVFTEGDVAYAIKLAKQDKMDDFIALFEREITKNANGKSIQAKTLGQQTYVSAMRRDDLVFGIGPAGTGKTFLAVVMAVHALRKTDVKRIVLTRPAVEAGESLGFLPGDLKEKVDPYLRPLYDGLNEVLGREQTARLIEKEVIEIAPLAYMRGRTLEDAYVILDEAQNTTPEQMKMCLTRLGIGSKMIVTGDITQVDLPKGVTSGLKIASTILSSVEGISFVTLEESDVVRHPLVQRIISAYKDIE